MKGLIPRRELRSVCASLKQGGASLVFTNGCFDLLHPGHLRLLERAASLGDRLIVAINSDDSVRRLKGEGRPVYPSAERAELLLAVRWVDLVTVFDEDTPLQTIEQVHPDVLVKGDEYLQKDIVGAKLVKGYGGKVARIPMKKGHSSRHIVNRIHGG
jgi:D-beta-D-heptose 7-phosphate kinase/D-beta-D-heptose 1-phosphate adenosyltransferase